MVGRLGCWKEQPGGGEGVRVVEVEVLVVGLGVGVPLQAAEVVHTGHGLPSPGMSQETCGDEQEMAGQTPTGWIGVGCVPTQFLTIWSRDV